MAHVYIEPTTPDQAPRQTTAPPPPSGGHSWFPIALLVIGGFWFWQGRQQPDPNPQPDPTPIVDPDPVPTPPKPTPDPNQQTVARAGCSLLFVSEKMAVTPAQRELMVGITQETITGMGLTAFRWWDEEQEEAAAYTKDPVIAAVGSPYVALVRDKRPLRAAAWPATRTELDRLLKQWTH